MPTELYIHRVDLLQATVRDRDAGGMRTRAETGDERGKKVSKRIATIDEPYACTSQRVLYSQQLSPS